MNKIRFSPSLLLVVLSLLLLSTLNGCSYEADMESSTDLQEREVANLISQIPEQLVKLAESKSFVSNLTAKIEQLPNIEQRKKWYYKAQDEVFKIDIAHLQYSQQFRCMRMFTEYLNKISAGSLKYEHYINPRIHSYSRIWQLRIRSLAWKKKQWDRLMCEFEKKKNRFKIVPIPESVLNEMTSLQYLAEDGAESEYNSYLDMVERDWWSDREWIDPVERETIQRELEAHLDRPIRTVEQVREDSLNRYKKWKKREKERAKKAGRVILVDGTK